MHKYCYHCTLQWGRGGFEEHQVPHWGQPQEQRGWGRGWGRPGGELILPGGIPNLRQQQGFCLGVQERWNARRDKRPYAANSWALDFTDIHSPFRLLTKQTKLCICINASNILPDMHTHLHMEIHLQEKSELYLKQKKSLNHPQGNSCLYLSFLSKIGIISG